MRRPVLILLLLLPGISIPALAQWPPDSLHNLQVLPDTIPVPELTRIMGGFTRALGVRCSACHVGEEGRPLSSYDFAADDKLLKRKAREMMRMVGAINARHLAALEARAAPDLRVECFTCHRGVRLPRTLQAELLLAYEAGGIDSSVATYTALRERYRDRAAYDFGEVALADVGGDLLDRGAAADAERLYALNLEIHPGSAFARRGHADAALQLAFADGGAAGAARYDELLAAYGPQVIRERTLNEVGYALLGRGDTAGAVAAFRLNAERHPGSANAHDSLGEGLRAAGDRAGALAAYRRALELDPGLASARSAVAELGG